MEIQPGLPPLNQQPPNDSLPNRRKSTAARIQHEALSQISAPKGHGRTTSAPVKRERTQAEWLAIIKQGSKRKAAEKKQKQARVYSQHVVHIPGKKQFSRYDTQLPIGPRNNGGEGGADVSIPVIEGATLVVLPPSARPDQTNYQREFVRSSPSGESDTTEATSAAPSPTAHQPEDSAEGEAVPLTTVVHSAYDGRSSLTTQKPRFNLGRLFTKCCQWVKRK